MKNIKGIRFTKKGIGSVLSPLECDVLDILWKCNNCRVQEIHKTLKNNKKKVALTSVAVILDRLHKKGIVTRKIEKGLGGGHYIYSVKESRKDFEESVVEQTVNKLMNTFGSVAANYFYKRFSEEKK